jgi:hypothetical protein
MIQKTTLGKSLTSATQYKFANYNFLQTAVITELREQFFDYYANTIYVVTTDCAVPQEHFYRSSDGTD